MTSRFKTLQTAYHNKPTALQQASFDSHLIDLVEEGDCKQFETLIRSGLSPNPCNAYGESLLHLLCRDGETEFLRILMDAGATVQVSDDYGRTLLHDACLADEPCFELIEILLQADPRMTHMTDCRGALPLSYVERHQYPAWIRFFESKKDLFWPRRDLYRLGEQAPHELACMESNSRPIPDPENALTAALAECVASGEMRPDEARVLMYTTDEEDATSVNGHDSYFVSEEDLSELNEDEMADILKQLTGL